MIFINDKKLNKLFLIIFLNFLIIINVFAVDDKSFYTNEFLKGLVNKINNNSLLDLYTKNDSMRSAELNLFFKDNSNLQNVVMPKMILENEKIVFDASGEKVHLTLINEKEILVEFNTQIIKLDATLTFSQMAKVIALKANKQAVPTLVNSEQTMIKEKSTDNLLISSLTAVTAILMANNSQLLAVLPDSNHETLNLSANSINVKNGEDNIVNCNFEVMKEGLTLTPTTDISVKFCSKHKSDNNCLYIRKIKNCDQEDEIRDDENKKFCKRVYEFKKCIVRSQKNK